MRLPCLGTCALLVTVLVIACDQVTTPTPIGVPATVTLTGTWFGSASDSHRQAQQLTLRLTQDGRNVTGSVTGTTVTSVPLYTSGSLTGTMSGSTLRFTILIPVGSVFDAPTCSVTYNGSTTDVTATGVTATGITGTYTGTDSCFGDLAAGRFTLAKQ